MPKIVWEENWNRASEPSVVYAYRIGFIEKEARNYIKGKLDLSLDEKYKPDNVFGKPMTEDQKDNYKEKDGIVTDTAMPALKVCLEKAGGTK